MKEESVFPRLEKCPKCSARLNTIRYGLHAGPPNWDEIDAGCAFDENAPTRACSNCEWRGGNGGRTWETSWVETRNDVDEANPGKTISITREFDLESMTDEELFECGESRLFPRYELAFRGYSPEDIDDFFESGSSLPLLSKEAILICLNTETNLIEQATQFVSHRMTHLYCYLRPGMSEWDSVSSGSEYLDVQSKSDQDAFEVWSLDLTIEYDADGEEGEWQHFGIPLLEKMLSQTPVQQAELDSMAEKFARSIPAPIWFEPGLFLRNMNRSF